MGQSLFSGEDSSLLSPFSSLPFRGALPCVATPFPQGYSASVHASPFSPFRSPPLARSGGFLGCRCLLSLSFRWRSSLVARVSFLIFFSTQKGYLFFCRHFLSPEMPGVGRARPPSFSGRFERFTAAAFRPFCPLIPSWKSCPFGYPDGTR